MQTTLVGTLALLGESLALAEALSVAREAIFDVLAQTPLASQAQRRRPTVESGDYSARFSLSLARKDMDQRRQMLTRPGGDHLGELASRVGDEVVVPGSGEHVQRLRFGRRLGQLVRVCGRDDLVPDRRAGGANGAARRGAVRRGTS